MSHSICVRSLLGISIIASAAFAAAPVIGVVTANGHFTLDQSSVWGNATLFNGGKLETGGASSEATLRNGVRVQLGANSSASILDHRITLWKGVGQVAASGERYEINAGGLTIHPTGENGRVRVRWVRDGVLEVASLSGAARVTTSSSPAGSPGGQGLLLALIPSSKKMDFAMQAAAAGGVNRSGCLVTKDGRYLLQDLNTQEVAEITGPNLADNVGNRVTVTGTASSARPSINIATVVINATNIVTTAQGGCLSVAAALDARTEPAGGSAPRAAASPTTPSTTAAPSGPSTAGKAGGGLSTGAKVGIAVAVIGGGAGAGIALAGGKKSTSP